MPSNSTHGARERLPLALLDLGFRRPKVVIASWLAIAVVASIGVARLRVDTSTDSFLDREGPEWSLYQKSIDMFGGDETLVVALRGKHPWDRDVLQHTALLTDRLERVDGVRRVDSLASVPVIGTDSEGDLKLDPALPTIPPKDADIDALPSVVAGDRVAPDSLISRDGRVVAVNVLLEPALGNEFDRVVHAVREAAPEATWVSGVPVFRTAINTRTGSEIASFSAATIILISAILYLAFRGVSAVVYPLCISGLGAWIMLGAMGFAGASITLSSMILPSVMLALGCAYTMHIVVAVQGLAESERIRNALGAVALPLALSGLTTAIGFLAIGATRIQGLRDVGVFGAIGVLSLSAAALTLLPGLLRFWPLQTLDNRTSEWITGNVRRALLVAIGRNRGWIFAVTAALVVVTGSGLFHLTIETDATRWFLPGSSIRDDYDAIRETLSGISPMNVVVESTRGELITRPDALAAIDGLATRLGSHPDVGKVLSVSDPLRQLNGSFSGDPSDPLPESSALSEQYLLLLSTMDRLLDVVTIDRKAANVKIRVDDNGSGHLLALADFVNEWWAENGPSDFTARTTGIMYEFARAEDEIAWGQLRGLAVAVVCVGLILVIALRSPRVAVVALIPNVVPIAAAYGLLGLVGTPLDAGTVLVGSVALGIAVDDTIHFVTAYQESRVRGDSPYRAVDQAFEKVLAPVVYTTVALSTGFAVLGLSEFTFTRNLGLLTAGIMVLCLAADLLLLPALLFARERGQVRNHRP